MVSWSVRPFLHSSPVCPAYRQTDRPADHATCDLCSNKPHPCTVCSKVKVKFFHTRYRALGPDLIPVYRPSARRWLEAIHPAVGCHYFLPGLRLPSQPLGSPANALPFSQTGYVCAVTGPNNVFEQDYCNMFEIVAHLFEYSCTSLLHSLPWLDWAVILSNVHVISTLLIFIYPSLVLKKTIDWQ